MPKHAHTTREPVISKSLAEELGEYKGRRVAIDQDHVVAFGDSVIEVIERARERSITDSLTFHVPAHPRRLAFYRDRK